MGYENKIPNLGKTVQSVRDTDFISITEVKAFDELIDEIVNKLSTINDNDVSDAVNIAQEIKKIEFNMADAINSDSSLNISSTPDPVTGEVGGPVYGENSIDKMLIKLDNLYNRFTKIIGEHGTEWKIDLENYYTLVYNNFKNTINAIFSNSVNSEAIEGKENSKYDYTKQSAVKLESNAIMRLNPDVAAYPRTINVILNNPNTDYIAFEVSELESKNLVMNLRFFNGSNYFSYNFIIDNEELFITKEESFKYNEYIYTIKLFKYDYNDSTKYVVTLSSDHGDVNTKYSFKVEGLLVGTYDFSTSGFVLSDHKKAWNYEIVDKTEITVPEYNVNYWYKEEIPVSDPSETSSDEFNWKSVTNLRSWDEKEYYIRKSNFTEVGKIEIDANKDSGTVNMDNKDITGKDVTSESYPTIINKKKYAKPLYHTHVDMDTSEIFEGNGNRENFIKNNDFYHLDEGVKFIHSNGKYTYEKRDGKRNIDGNIVLASGNNIINLGTLKSKSYIEFNDNVNNSVTKDLFSSIDDSALYVDFTDTTELTEDKLTDIYGSDSPFVTTILDFVDFFVNKLSISSNNKSLINSDLQKAIKSSDDIIVDGIRLFIDNNDSIYVLPKYNTVVYDTDENFIKDISILKLVDSNYEGITNDLLPLSYKLILFGNKDESSYENVDLTKYKLILDSDYNKLFDIESDSKGIEYLILEYDSIHDKFIKDKLLSDLFVKTPFIDCISKIDVKRYIDNNDLFEFIVNVDGNRESDTYKYIYNNGENDIEFPNIVNRRDYASSEEVPMKFISSSSNEHLTYSINGNGELYYSIDGRSWKKDSRVDYDKFNSFELIEYDTQSLWFAICHSEDTDKRELVYSSNGYDWNLVNREENGIGSDENIIKYKNVAINRYFLGTDKYAYMSEDGIIWTKTNIPTGEWRDCAWNRKKFVVVGSIGAYQVLDGNDFDAIATGFTLCTGSGGDWSNAATYEEYPFVICGKSGVMYSTSNYLEETNVMVFGRNSSRGFPSTCHHYYDNLANNKCFFSGNTYIGGGFIDKNGIFQYFSNTSTKINGDSVTYSSDLKIYVLSSGNNTGLYYSFDGRYWISSNITTGTSGYVYWDSDLKIFVTGIVSSGIVYSTDGKTWTKSNISSGVSSTSNIFKFKDVLILNTTTGTAYSTDGKTWTNANITSSNARWRFATDGNILITTGDKGNIYSSTDGKSWTLVYTSSSSDNFTSLIYNDVYKKFYASSNASAIIYSSTDGKTWSALATTSGKKGMIVSNGNVIVTCAQSHEADPDGQMEYSIDGGQTWSTVKGLTNIISSWFLIYVKEFDTFYAGYNRGTDGIVYSRNGIDWNYLFEPTPTEFTGETKLISTHAEDDTSEYILGYFFIVNGKDIHRSKDGKYWQKISYDSEIIGMSAVGVSTDRDAFLFLKDKGILVSTRNDEALDSKFSTYGENFVKTSITDGTYNDAIQTVNSDTNNTAYIVQSDSDENKSIRINKDKNSYTPITFKNGDKISFIGDIGDNDLIAVSNNEYLNYDRQDHMYTPDVAVGNRNINFIKKITDKTTILGLDNSLIFTNEFNNDVYTKSDISFSDIIVTTFGIYGLNNDVGIIEITNPDSSAPEFTEAFSDLSTYNIRNIFEYSNRDLLFVAYKDSKYTLFRKKYNETTYESLGEFSGSIQFVDLVDDKLILLVHSLNNNGTEVNYTQNIFFDNNKDKIVTQELIDIEKVIRFDHVIKYNGELYVFNTYSDTDDAISMNFGKIVFNNDGTLGLNYSDNGNMVHNKSDYQENKYPKWNGFVYKDKLYFYKYCEPINSEEYEGSGLYTIETTDTTNGWNVVKLIDSHLNKIFNKWFTDELVVQGSLDNSLITHDESTDNYKSDLDSSSKMYKNDKLYFDKETKGMTLGKYHSKGIFKLYTEMLTAVKSEIGDNINIALALGVDAKIALYDKDYDFLKVLDFKYIADLNSSGVPYYLNISDSDDAVITNIYSGTKETENWLYFVVKDKFKVVSHDSYGNFSVGTSDSVSLRLFKVFISSIKSDIAENNDKITCEWVSDITGLDNIDNIKIAFSRDGITKTDPLVIENYNGLQYIISGKNLRYSNVDSIASFNVNTSCLIVTSKIIWDSKFVDIIDQNEDINNDMNYTTVVVCPYDYNKVGKLDDTNRSISHLMLLNTESNGTIEKTYVNIPNNGITNIGKRLFSTCKNATKYTTSLVDKNLSTRYPGSYLSSNELGLETSFNPSRIIETSNGGFILDIISTSNINNGGYFVNKYNDSITLDKFSDGNKFYYNNVKDTTIGLFRWFDTSVNSYRPSEFESGSDAQNIGWLYYTPKNGGKTVRFDLGPKGYVYNIYDTYAGIFLAVRKAIKYGDEFINDSELYRLINIPNTNEIVQMGDPRYFQKCNCGDDPVIDIKDTSQGIFMIAFYSTRTRIFKWNGNDFYNIRMDLNYTTGLKRIFDTSIGVFFVGNKKEWGLFQYFPSLDQVQETSYKVYINNWISTKNIDTIETERGIYVTGTKTGTDNTKIIYDLRVNKSIELENIGDIGLPKEIKVYPYASDEFFAYKNYFKKLAEKLYESYNLPLDKWMKTVGSIDINGVNVPIKGLKIVSGAGVGNEEPDNVIFSIDQNARFNGITAKLIDLPKDGNITGSLV